MTLKRLYKISKGGGVQICDISTKDNVITLVWGILGGKMQTQEVLSFGKNLGKKNATTDNQQAILEAKSRWTRKKNREGYVTKELSAKTKEDEEEEAAGPILAMKVKVWTKGKLPYKTDWPLISTPKYNGVNGTYVRNASKKLKLYSRTGIEYPPIPHLEADIHKAMDLLECSKLNGELYIDDEHLQYITSAVKKPKELSKTLTFMVFAIPDSYYDYDYINGQFIVAEDMMPNSSVKFVKGEACFSHEDIELHYKICMANGLEGTVIKHPLSRYEAGVRTNMQWKYKKTQDTEKRIVDYNLDKNGHPIFHVEVSKGGATFKVKLKGTNEERLEMAKIADSLIGKWLKLEYEVLSADNIPLKPIGLSIRECDDDGNPLE